jgi:2,3-bisphosphoglycerate-independent phosphoglycerate mutase
MNTLNENAGLQCPGSLEFVAGVSYRNLAILRNCSDVVFDQTTKTSPPHDYTDKPIADALPTGNGSDLLRTLMNESRKIFADHPVNRKRLADGKLPATQIWLWGQGQKPQLPLFKDKPNAPQRGAMITAVDLLRGIAKNIGWRIIDVPGITGYIDTDFAAKGHYAAEALKEYDIVCVHIEATDEAGHEGNAVKKVQALEDIDAKTVPPIVEALKQYEQWKLFISPDHPTPCVLKTHTTEYVPWLLVSSEMLREKSGEQPAQQCNQKNQRYDEETARNAKYRFDEGHRLFGEIFDGKICEINSRRFTIN